MMHPSEVIPLHRAKRTLSKLVQRAAAGETVLIGSNGRAIAKLTSLGASESPKRCLGLLKGKLVVPEDFDSPLPDEVLADFESGRRDFLWTRTCRFGLVRPFGIGVRPPAIEGQGSAVLWQYTPLPSRMMCGDCCSRLNR